MGPCDIDNDGDQDLVATSAYWGWGLAVFTNGEDSFKMGAAYFFAKNHGGESGRGVFCGDLNNDLWPLPRKRLGDAESPLIQRRHGHRHARRLAMQ